MSFTQSVACACEPDKPDDFTWSFLFCQLRARLQICGKTVCRTVHSIYVSSLLLQQCPAGADCSYISVKVSTSSPTIFWLQLWKLVAVFVETKAKVSGMSTAAIFLRYSKTFLHNFFFVCLCLFESQCFSPYGIRDEWPLFCCPYERINETRWYCV